MMGKTAIIGAILAQYQKHEWVLRRVLLTESTKKSLERPEALFGAVPVDDYGKDAAWFARPSGRDGEAWEIRLLSETPFALIHVFGPEQGETERGEIRAGMEERLLAAGQF